MINQLCIVDSLWKILKQKTRKNGNRQVCD